MSLRLVHPKREIWGIVAESLSPEAEGGVRAHLAGCAECRRLYDTLAAAERLSEGLADPAAAFSRREGRASKWAILDLLDRAGVPSGGRAPDASHAWRPALLAFAAGVLLALPVLLKAPPSTGSGGRAWRGTPPRGAALEAYAVDLPSPGAPPEVRRLEDLAQGDRGHALARRGEYLQFRVGSWNPSARYVAVFGVDERGGIHPYFPQGERAESAPLGSKEGWQVLGPSVRVSAAYPPGLLRVFAVVSPVPFPAGAVEEALRGLRERGDPVRAGRPLPLTGGTDQASLLLEVADR